MNNPKLISILEMNHFLKIYFIYFSKNIDLLLNLNLFFNFFDINQLLFITS
jgi:hypothetical protein